MDIDIFGEISGSMLTMLVGIMLGLLAVRVMAGIVLFLADSVEIGFKAIKALTKVCKWCSHFVVVVCMTIVVYAAFANYDEISELRSQGIFFSSLGTALFGIITSYCLPSSATK